MTPTHGYRILVTALLALWSFGDASAISTDIQTFSVAGGSPPNILFLMDSSGSMGSAPDTCPTCGKKWDLAKQAVADMVDVINPPDGAGGHIQNARMGLFQFDGSQGGRLLVEIYDGNEEVLKATALGASQAGGTPLGRALIDMARYYAGSDGWDILPKWGDGFISSESPLVHGNPIDLECRQNFIVAMSDGASKNDGTNKYGTVPPLNKPAQCVVIGAGDGDGDAEACAGGTDWMDDAAYAMHRYDFAPGLPGMQNLIVHTIGFDSDPQILKDVADNAGGTYQAAADGADLAAAYVQAVQTIFDGLVSFTGTTVPSSRSAFADGLFNAYFHASANNAFWPGHIEAYRLSPTLQILGADGTSALDASGQLDPDNAFWDVADRLLDPTHPPRKLYTAMAGVRTDFTAANIAAADLNLLAADLALYDPAVYPDVETLADGFVSYMYGQDAFDDDADANLAELRDAVLGDVFHSSPISIGPPPGALAQEDGYGPFDLPGTFMAQHKQRKRRLYVGANDGMLHAIDVGSFFLGDNGATPEIENGYYDLGTGNEMFGYVPSMLLPTLKQIPQNMPRNFYYVDGTPSATDAWFPSGPGDTTKEPAEWTTVLVTGLREGGAGYFALDVTDPDAVAGPHAPYPKLLWEFSDPAEPLGQAWSEPILTRVKVAASAGNGDKCGPDDGDGDCREQWVAIFGGGYLPQGDANLTAYAAPSDPGWTDKGKAIFVVALDSGAVLARVAYDVADPQLSQMTHTVASTPAVLDFDFDGFADLVLIGDAGGQLWKWDLSQVGTDGADPDTLIDNWAAGVFFRADPVDMGGGTFHYHSIFFPPSVTFINDKLTYAFGTGERSNLQYSGTPGVDDNNRFYVIQDPNPTGGAAIPSTPYTESDITNVTGLATDPDLTDLGFYFVAAEGEKYISGHIAFGGFLITTSYNPNVMIAGPPLDPCTSGGGGTASLFVFDLELGGGFFSAAVASDQGRKLGLGSGVAGEPRITMSAGKATIFVKTSKGQIIITDAPDLRGDPVELVYWRQRF